jgi:predicted membrane-bound dolichyl-phosphate-mannose-protein mannosyltransferase
LEINNFNERAMYNAYKHVEENPDIFNLVKTASIENAAKIIKTVSKVVCGYPSIRFKVGRKE